MIDQHLLEQWSWQSVEQATAQTKDPGKWRKMANARFAELIEAHVREACALDALQLVGANANGAIRHAENRIWDDAITEAAKRIRERGAKRDAAK